MRALHLLVAAALLLVAAPAFATVDVLLDVNVPYQQLQTDDVCFARTPMWAQVGIPVGSAIEGSLKPWMVYRQTFSGTSGHVNLNLLAEGKPIGFTFVSDAYVGTTYEVSVVLDVTALSAANGTTVAGRTKTLRAAKLALLAVVRDLDDLTVGLWRVKVKFVGLPSQTSLPGTKLYATTSSPYSAASALLAAYTKELVNREGSCPE